MSYFVLSSFFFCCVKLLLLCVCVRLPPFQVLTSALAGGTLLWVTRWHRSTWRLGSKFEFLVRHDESLQRLGERLAKRAGVKDPKNLRVFRVPPYTNPKVKWGNTHTHPSTLWRLTPHPPRFYSPPTFRGELSNRLTGERLAWPKVVELGDKPELVASFGAAGWHDLTSYSATPCKDGPLKLELELSSDLLVVHDASEPLRPLTAEDRRPKASLGAAAEYGGSHGRAAVKFASSAPKETGVRIKTRQDREQEQMRVRAAHLLNTPWHTP